MRYSLESGAKYYMFSGGSISSCVVDDVDTANCAQKFVLDNDGTAASLVANYSYAVTTKSWYTDCQNYGVPTWSDLSLSTFTAGLYVQHFSAPIYESPNLKTVRGVATVSVNLAYCKYFLVFILLFCHHAWLFRQQFLVLQLHKLYRSKVYRVFDRK